MSQFGVDAAISSQASETSTTSSSYLNAELFSENPDRHAILATARYRLEESQALGPPNPATSSTPSVNTPHIPRCIWDLKPLAHPHHILDAVKTLFYRATHSLAAWNTFTSPQPPNPTAMSLTVFRPVGTESFIRICITRCHDHVNTRTTIHTAVEDLHTRLGPAVSSTLASLLPDVPPSLPRVGTFHNHLALKSRLSDDQAHSWTIEHWSSEAWSPGGEAIKRVKTTENNAAFRRRVVHAARLVVFVGVMLDELMWDQDEKDAESKGFVRVDLE